MKRAWGSLGGSSEPANLGIPNWTSPLDATEALLEVLCPDPAKGKSYRC